MSHSAAHHKITNIGRHKGRSSTAAAAYRTGLRIVDERTGAINDYTRRDGVLAHFNIGWPDDETSALWNTIEKHDGKRTKINVARESTLALPHELPLDEQVRIVKGYTLWLRDKYGIAATCAIHAPSKVGDHRNIHAHILETTRKISKDGTVGEKVRVLDDKKTGTYEFEARREEWAKRLNRSLEKHGIEKRVDHRSLDRRYVDDEDEIRREPVPHYGPAKMAEARRRNDEAKRAAKAGKPIPPLTPTQALHQATKHLNGLYKHRHEEEAANGIHEARKRAEAALVAEGAESSTTSLWSAISRFVGAPGLIEYCQALRQRLRGSTSLSQQKATPQPATTQPPIPAVDYSPAEPITDITDKQAKAWREHQANDQPATRRKPQVFR